VFTRPDDLTDAQVRDALVSGWALDVGWVEHAPVGFGSHHWWVTTGDGCRWFATADDLRTRRLSADEPLSRPMVRLDAALSTAAGLREHGLEWVVAPRRNGVGELVVPVGEAFALSVFPRVEGRSFGWGPYEDPVHRAAVLDCLVALHTTTGCREVAATDDLGHELVAGLRALAEDLGEAWTEGPFAREAWRLVVGGRARLGALVDRYARLVGDVDPARFVLTHGEPHRGNTLVTDTGVVLVDWDTCLLAPPERDLWWVEGEDAGIRQTYEERTGVGLDPRLLEAYRLRWDLADVASFVTELREPHVDDDDTRTAWAGLRSVLEEGRP
jgi:spectinomycin phosphotransferase/16S rRNA (guanine(1405)-N(7))-methyltransferase